MLVLLAFNDEATDARLETVVPREPVPVMGKADIVTKLCVLVCMASAPEVALDGMPWPTTDMV